MDSIQAPLGAVEEAKRLVQEHYGGDVNAWIVGSRATGDAGPGSDLDVVVQTPPAHRKHVDGEPPNQGFGAGKIFQDTECGVEIDITEDEDGPIAGEGHSRLRIQ